MAIGTDITNVADDDVSAVFDDEPTELRSYSGGGTQCNPRKHRQNIAATQKKRKQDLRPNPSSFLVDFVFQALRFFSGVTISTTSTLLRPPLRMTQSFVLPEIGYALSNYYNDLTPERAKLWIKVLPSFLTQSIQVLARTKRGVAFGNKLSSTASIGLETFSTEEMMQVLLSSVALWVKVAHALQTPEVHEALVHNAELACQWLDALSSPGMKRLIKELRELVWAAIELAADDQTTSALAHVTATLCHALESGQLDDIAMEQHDESINNIQDNKVDSGEWTSLKESPNTCSESEVSSSDVVLLYGSPEIHNQNPSLPTSIHTKNETEDSGARVEGKSEDSCIPNTLNDTPTASAMQLFMRMFEETINVKRSETILSMLQKQDCDGTTSEQKGSKGNSESENCGFDDREQEDLKAYYTQWWHSDEAAAASSSLHASNGRRRHTRRQRAIKVDVARERLTALLGCVILVSILFFSVLFSFGIYGFYKILTVPVQPPLQPEVVVRVIREVIHLSADGQVLDRQLLGEYPETTQHIATEPFSLKTECSASTERDFYVAAIKNGDSEGNTYSKQLKRE